jgi:hypothetical protein
MRESERMVGAKKHAGGEKENRCFVIFHDKRNQGTFLGRS